MPKKKKNNKNLSTERKKIIKNLTEDEAKKIVRKSIIIPGTNKAISPKLKQEVKEHLEGSSDQKVTKDSAMTQFLAMESLDNHSLLAACCDEEYRPLVISFAEGLTKEFECQTPSEKALVHVVVNAYYRILRCSTTYNNKMHPDWLSSERVGFLNNYSKELDKANRQFITALETLKALKQPPIKMNIKTQNAYLAQNQQINNPPQDEIIEE